MKEYSDDEIIQGIRAGGLGTEQVIRFLYQSGGIKDEVIRFIKSKMSNDDVSEDIFQEGVVHLIMNVRKGNYKGDGTVKGYLFGICRNLWLKKLRTKGREISLEEFEVPPKEEVDFETPEYHFENRERRNLISEVMGKLGEMCKQVLSFWQLNYSMKEIAEKLGYKSEGVVRKKKHQCMKKLIDMVQGNPSLVKMLKGI